MRKVQRLTETTVSPPLCTHMDARTEPHHSCLPMIRTQCKGSPAKTCQSEDMSKKWKILEPRQASSQVSSSVLTVLCVAATKEIACLQCRASVPFAFTHEGKLSSFSPGFHFWRGIELPASVYPIALRRSRGPTGRGFPSMLDANVVCISWWLAGLGFWAVVHTPPAPPCLGPRP